LPGKYDENERRITLETELVAEPILTTATLINKVVADFLFVNNFKYARFPELVDLAVVSMGLGLLQSQIGFVKETGSFWDTTQWERYPRPFLETQSLAYASAMVAWSRDDNSPTWMDQLPVEVKKPMQKSLKYLTKSKDSFFVASPANHSLLSQSQTKWLDLLANGSSSQQIIATRHLEFGESAEPQEKSLVEKLYSSDRDTLLHAIAATERIDYQNDNVIEAIRLSVENRDEEIRAKAMIALTRFDSHDEHSINEAAKMLDCPTRFVVFAGLFGLSSLDSVPDSVLKAANRRFIQALQKCDYEFIGLFAGAFNGWLDDPKQHFDHLLSEDSPEYYEIAMESLENIREQLVEIN
jgi:hypothetical protein